MSPFTLAAIVLAVVAAMFALQWWRRQQANRAARSLGGTVGAPGQHPLPAGYPQQPGSVGAPNPALPPPASVDHRPQTSGPPVQLQICGLPAIAWQRSEWLLEHRQAMQLHLWVDTAVGLPFLQLYYRGPIARAFRGTPATLGIPALDDRFQASGDVAAWVPVLARPDVTQALLAFPLNSVDVFGGRIAFESLDGVHLDPGAVSALAQIAATLIGAIPAQITSASAAAPLTARIGSNPGGDPDSVVRNVLAGTTLTPQQQEAALRAMRASEARDGQGR